MLGFCCRLGLPVTSPRKHKGLAPTLVFSSLDAQERIQAGLGNGSVSVPGRPPRKASRSSACEVGLPSLSPDLLPSQARRMTTKALPLPACVTPEIMLLAR